MNELASVSAIFVADNLFRLLCKWNGMKIRLNGIPHSTHFVWYGHLETWIADSQQVFACENYTGCGPLPIFIFLLMLGSYFINLMCAPHVYVINFRLMYEMVNRFLNQSLKLRRNRGKNCIYMKRWWKLQMRTGFDFKFSPVYEMIFNRYKIIRSFLINANMYKYKC